MQFMIQRSLLLIVLCCALYRNAGAQNHCVVDAHSGRPLIAATVRLTCLAGSERDSTKVVLSNQSGHFANPFKQATAVKITYVGYTPLLDTLRDTAAHTFQMEESEVTLDRIVVTAQYGPQESNLSIYKVRVLDANDIAERGASTLRDLLGSELNMRVSQDEVLGSGISMQGLTGQHIKILIDGVPVVGRQNGKVDISQLLLASAERVEIIEGPLSTLYGTDALGGVINILTKQPGNTPEATAKVLYESVGTYNADASLNWSLMNTHFQLSGGRHLFDGYSSGATQRSMQWKPKESYFCDWQATQQLGDWSMRYSGKYFYEYILNRGEPRSPYYETAFDDTYKTYRLSNTLFAEGAAGDNSHINLTAGYSTYMRRKNSFYKNLVTLEERLTSDPSDHDTSHFGAWLLRGVFTTNDRTTPLNYQAGFDLNLDINSGKRVEGVEQSIGDYAVFAGAQYTPVEGLTFQPSLRLAHNTRYKAPLIPSLSIRAVPMENTTLRLSYARGFRAPSLRELYFLFVDINHNIRGNRDLQAETSHSITGAVSWTAELPSSRLVIEPSFFMNFLDNLITLAHVDSSLYSYVNIGKYRTVGGGVSASWYHADLFVQAGISYTGQYNSLSESYDVSEVLYTPEVQATVRYTLPVPNTRLTATYKYTGETPGYTLNAESQPVQSFTADYHMMDISLSTSFFDSRLDIGLGCKNLFNVQNIRSGLAGSGDAHSSAGSDMLVAWGRTLFCTLQYTVQ